MANHGSDNATKGAAPAQGSLLGRAFALLRSIRTNPIHGGIALVVGLLVIGLAAFSTSMLLPKKAKSSEQLVNEAFEHLDAGDYREARKLAATARAVSKQEHEADGRTLFLLGAALAHDARQDLNPTERRTLNLIAARYLEEARLKGLPYDREVQSNLLLGQCLHGGGRYAAAIPLLRDLHVEDPAEQRDILAMLADCYLQLTPPALDKALEVNRGLLALPDISERDKQEALLQQAQILMAERQWAAALETLDNIPESSTLHGQALLLTARVVLRDVTDAAWTSRKATDEQIAEYDALLTKLAPLQDTNKATPEVAAQAQLLAGVAELAKNDPAAALSRFSKVRRAFAGRPEALAAMLHEAELQQAKGDAVQSLALYERLTNEAGSAETYVNPVLPLSQLEARLMTAFDRYLAAHQYEEAVKLAAAVSPLLSEVRSVEMTARAHREWGSHLIRSAPAELAARGVIEAEARDHFRQAGAAYEKLAELRVATRHYLDDLSASAQNYREGHGFRQSSRMYRLLLKQQASKNQPDTLTGLGASLLSEGNPEDALGVLNECREMYPNHPATYQARLLAAQALEELGKIEEAKQLLADNLYKYSLTPQSTEWRDSLFALGNLLYRDALMQEARSRNEGVDSSDVDRRRSALIELEKAHALFREALKTLTEAVKRYPQAPQQIEARYRIAECYRHCAKWPRKRLSIITIETTRVSLHKQMQQDLLSAVDEYSQLIAMLGDDKEPYRSPLERSVLRNSYFARGDALFDLGRYEDAIKAYSAATNRFQHEPEALEAYVQIAACYRRLNRPVEARGTLEQARIVLSRIKEDADFLRTTRCTREEWGQRLNWLATL